MIKRIVNIQISFTDENYTKNETFHQESPVDEFLNWLVVEGFYDDIQATKRFNVKTEVMKRLKGE